MTMGRRSSVNPGTAATRWIASSPGLPCGKSRERAIRYIFLDAGHICQNLMLATTALGLGCCPVGAFFDGEVEQLAQVDGQEEVALYLAAVG